MSQQEDERTTLVTESLVDAKDEARQAEVRTDIAGVRADIAGALLTIIQDQRQSDRAAFQRTMWLIATVIASVAAAAGLVIAVLQ